MKQHCSYQKTDGTRCRGYAVKDSLYCFFHVANGAAARLAGSRGGKKKGDGTALRRKGQGGVDLNSVQDVIAFLGGSINDVILGEVNSSTAKSMGYLANILIKALRQEELNARIESITGNRDLYMRLSGDFSEDGDGNDEGEGAAP